MVARRVTDEQRATMLAAGTWGAFQKRRDELKAMGHAPAAARVIALGEFVGDGAALEAAAVKRGADPMSIPGAKAAAAKAKVKASSPESDLPVAPGALAGKVAAEPEIARWVARHIDHPNPDPVECPDPFAWTLLRMCRASPAFTHAFIRDVWVKLLVSEAKKQGAETTVVLDGKPTLELIERILEMRKRAEGGQEGGAVDEGKG